LPTLGEGNQPEGPAKGDQRRRSMVRRAVRHLDPSLVADLQADKRGLNHENAMRFQKLLKITSRASSITNSFVQAIIPSYPPSAAEVQEALHVLGMESDNLECVYCGAPATDTDHLFPLVRGKKPTGYLHEQRLQGLDAW